MIVMLAQIQAHVPFPFSLFKAPFPYAILGWSTGRGYAFAVLFLLCATVVGSIVYLWTIRPPSDGGNGGLRGLDR